MSELLDNKPQASKPNEPTNMIKGEALLQYLQKAHRQKKFTKTKPKVKKTESQGEEKIVTKEELKDNLIKEDTKARLKKRDSQHEEQGDTSNKKTAENLRESVSSVALKTLEDFEHFNEGILKELEATNDKVYLTKTEKKCLEEITKFTTKVRAPLDERQMMFYNKDCDKFTVPVNLKESDDQSECQLREAAKAVNESPSKIMTTELNTLVSYLVSLKSLIAKREMAWASTAENDYAQKAEIKRLKTEVENLRVICTKRQSEIREKEQIIANKEQELIRWQKIVQRLKHRLLILEKENGREDDMDEQIKEKAVARVFSVGEPQRKTKLQLVEDALLAVARNRRGVTKKPQGRESGGEIRRNQGPAAMLANALYNARNEGNFVHF